MILLYHRIAELDRDPQLLAVTPHNFAAHLDVLREFATFAPLAEVVRARLSVSSYKRAAITFDDGYADNLHFASPILHRQGVPATVFAAAAGLANTREFFWDDLDRIFLSANRLPQTLQLTIGANTVNLDLGQDHTYTGGHEDWDVTHPKNPTLRHAAYKTLCNLLHNATVAQRQAALDQIHHWSNLSPEPRASHRMMTPSQLRALTATGLIDVGAHTVNHPLLRVESRQGQPLDIPQSKATLESILDRPVSTFAYPFGGRRDYTMDTIAAVHHAGFDLACSNFPGQLQPALDPFQLPRFLVRNWSADEFRVRLSTWIDRRMSLAA
jgi:peptidoglycan/xylan/chitin deacetylase (PgdA/CDA1 family)